MISTDTIGVGINRNLALQLSKADILLFADDDIVYYDGELREVVNAFQQFPDADVIFFGIDMTRDGEVFDKRRNKAGRVHLWNSLRYGCARMAIRRDAVIKNRLAFSTLFGGGSLYGSGEDTILIRDCFHAGLRVYSHDYVLGKCAKDTSTWFSGYNDKFFYDWGAMVACAFPKGKHCTGHPCGCRPLRSDPGSGSGSSGSPAKPIPCGRIQYLQYSNRPRREGLW